MRFTDHVFGYVRALFRSRSIDSELSEEMQFHLEREAAANIERGMSAQDAVKAARLKFGSVDSAHEDARDNRPGVTLRQLVQDVRFGARLLLKTPVFLVTGIAIVALGIGSATAVFSVVHGVILKPLPFHQPQQLVSIWLQRSLGRNLPAAADAYDLRQLSGVFQEVALFRNANLTLVGGGEPQRLQGARVSANLFSLLGVDAALGRTFAPNDDQPGHTNVVILSDALWRTRFGGDRSIVGQNIALNGTPYAVVGVMPPDFQYPSAAFQAWVPLVVDPAELTRTLTNNYRVIARLNGSVTIDQARAAANTLAKRLAVENRPDARTGIIVDSMLDDAVRDVRPALALLLGAVSLLLLIACVNLSNLFGARAIARNGEFAVRLALGASRARLIAQLIAESVPVLLLGGGFGIVFAEGAIRLFVAAAPDGIPRIENIALNVPVILFSLVLLTLTGGAASIAPAVQAWSSDFTTITKDGGRSSTSGRKRVVVRNIGVAAQIAFAIPLLAGGALLLRSAFNVARVDMGFIPDRILTLSFEVSRTVHVSDVDVADYYTRLIDAVSTLPGVEKVSLTNRIPLGGGQTNPVRFENATGVVDEFTNVDTRTVSPDYFATLGIKLIDGRSFSDRDGQFTEPVAVVDERIAKTVWPGESPIGKRFRGPTWRNDNWVTVVGVVAHIRSTGLETDPLPQVYWSYRQWAQDRMVLAVRANNESNALQNPIVRAIHSVEVEQSVYDVRTLTDIVNRSLSQRRLTTVLMFGFSAFALLLAAVGIYGVVAYGVSQRSREFGIRLALGATGRELKRLVVWQGTSMTLAGSAAGLAIAIAASGVMRNLVFGVAPSDFMSIAAAAFLLIVIGAIASYIPARRAAAVDAGLTLRGE